MYHSWVIHIILPVLQHILSEPDEVVTMVGQKLPLRCSVDYISFSAHTDYQQTSEFVRGLKPTHIVSLQIEDLNFYNKVYKII